MNVYELQPRFAALFDGLKIAHGTGRGQWIKRPLEPEDWVKHLNGDGPGIGVAPLREDSTVAFAAIDLDEPDFETAHQMQSYIPGTSWVERSRSGNAHVWVFFEGPCPAWVAMGILKEAVLAAGKTGVEVFPKNHDFQRVRLGNYINLPYHGSDRPILRQYPGPTADFTLDVDIPWDVTTFVHDAEASRNDPAKWIARAEWLQLVPPGSRSEASEFGAQPNLHICAEHIIHGNAGTISHGHQNATLFMLSKCLTNWNQVDHDEALDMLVSVAKDLFDPVPSYSEIRRILTNVERARYTSTGCDDPLVQPYTHPDCPISHPRRLNA